MKRWLWIVALILLGWILVLMWSGSGNAGDISYSNGVQNPKSGINGAGGAGKVNNGNADVSVTTFSFFGAPPQAPRKHKKKVKHGG